MPEPLPHPNPFNLNTGDLSHSAYQRCLDLEDRHETIPPLHPNSKFTSLICARLPGYMLLEATSQKGRTEVATEIMSGIGDQEMLKMGEMYKNHFLRCFRSTNARTPTPSSHTSAPSSDAQKEGSYIRLHLGTLEPKRWHALERDGYCCLISRTIDSTSALAGLVQGQDTPWRPTISAHIFDRSTNEDLDDAAKKAYTTSIHAMLTNFGQIDTLEELNGPRVHRLENILTMDMGLHSEFDKLHLWLKRQPQDPPNQYRLCAVNSGPIRDLQQTVTFTNHSATSTQYPLPDPRYLAVHAACARVAHLSGVGEHIDQILRDLEEMGVLAGDGSSDLLTNALVRHLDIKVF